MDEIVTKFLGVLCIWFLWGLVMVCVETWLDAEIADDKRRQKMSQHVAGTKGKK